MDKKLLNSFIEQGLSTTKIAKEFTCSQTNIMYWVKKYKLITNPKPKDFHCSCGETRQEKFYRNKKTICRHCHNKYTIKKYKETRDKILEFLGDKCSQCGFDKFKSALDVHHLDPTIKDKNFSHSRGWKWNRLEKELKGCVLLCKCCHAAIHSGELI